MNNEELNELRQDATEALAEYVEAGANSSKKHKAKVNASAAVINIIKILVEDAVNRVPKEFENEIVRTLWKSAREVIQENAKVPAYTVALEGAFEVIKAQGIDLTAEHIVEIVKAVTEYQCKVVEAQSYKDWAEAKGR